MWMSSSERSGKSRSPVAPGDGFLEVGVLEPLDARAAAVLHQDDVAQLRQVVADRRDPRRELPLHDEADHVRVVAEVAQLRLDVPVVDVHRHGAELVERHHRLDPLDAVVAVDPDVVALADPRVAQVVREPVGPVLELRERPAGVADDRARCGPDGCRRSPRTGRRSCNAWPWAETRTGSRKARSGRSACGRRARGRRRPPRGRRRRRPSRSATTATPGSAPGRPRGPARSARPRASRS